jgi:hypothetical protein
MVVVLLAVIGVSGAGETVRPPRVYGNFRLGTSTFTRNGRPEMCLELAPHELISIEGCGTGAGFLHRDPAPELGHFRANLRLASWRTPYGWIRPQFGLGFAELSIDEDDPGFQFGGTGTRGIETAGPEATLSLRILMPLLSGVEGIVEVGVSGAWLPHAPDLIRPQSVFQPSAGVSLGVGF